MIRHIFSEALNALGHYRLRSVLTMLSITWGVASLMLLLAYGYAREPKEDEAAPADVQVQTEGGN